MNGYTPWEVAALKQRYHRVDVGHKGYLDRGDVDRLLSEARCPDTAASVVFDQLDRNHDDAVTFEELAWFLANTPSPEAARLRAHMLQTDATLAAGATMGLLAATKAKAFVAVGAFLADPIRLFRDYYVEYTTSLRAHSKATRRKSFVAAVRNVGLLSGLGWFLFSVLLDSAVGAAMFVSYAHGRAYAAEVLRQRGLAPEWLRKGSPDDDRDAANRKFHRRQFALEVAGGICAGAVSGTLEAPAQALAASHLRPKAMLPAMRRQFRLFQWRLARAMLAHPAFFSTFYAARVLGSTLWVDVTQHHPTSFSGAMLTAGSGCFAGAGYRVVAMPIDAYSSILRHGKRGLATHRRRTRPQQIAHLYTGLGRSLAFTMPVTGIFFLVYEYALMYL
jgi:hypothetical protein